MPAYESFTLGGPLKLSGYRVNQFAGREYVFGRAMYYNRTLPLPDLLGRGIYVGASAKRVACPTGSTASPRRARCGPGPYSWGGHVRGSCLFRARLGKSGTWSLYLLLVHLSRWQAARGAGRRRDGPRPEPAWRRRQRGRRRPAHRTEVISASEERPNGSGQDMIWIAKA